MTYRGFSVPNSDWLSLARKGAANNVYILERWIPAPQGSLSISTTLAPGEYVIRGHLDWYRTVSYAVAAEVPFTVGTAGASSAMQSSAPVPIASSSIASSAASAASAVSSAPAFASSAPLASGPSLTLDKATYAAGETVRVSYRGFPNVNGKDWVSLARKGSSPMAIGAGWKYLTGQQGVVQLPIVALPPGEYVVRGFLNDNFTIVVEVPFTVR